MCIRDSDHLEALERCVAEGTPEEPPPPPMAEVEEALGVETGEPQPMVECAPASSSAPAASSGAPPPRA
eukprot:4050906-Alexandrium_andersonii.AAC.1